MLINSEDIKKFFKEETKPLVLISVLFFIAAFLCKYKMMNLYIDFGREVSIPKAILDGKVLYKDIFNLYGPVSYLFNGFLINLFGVNLKTFNIIGLINSYLIINGIYFISRNFLNKILSTTLALFVMFCCVFVPFVTNYITPYSYAMVFGMSAVIFAILSVFKYIETDKKRFLYIAYFLAGIAFANKFEYLFCIIPLLGLSFYKKNNIKDFLLSIVLWICPIALCYLILAVQGLRPYDYSNYMQIMMRYVKSPLLSEFYSGTMTFSLTNFLTEAVMFLFSGILFWAIYTAEKKSNNLLVTVICFALTSLLFYKFEYISTLLFFYYFPLFLIILTFVKFKQIKTNTKLIFLILTTIAVGTKSLFLLNIAQYGRYFLPLLTLCLVVVLKDYYFKSSEKVFEKSICILLSALILSNILIYSKQFNDNKYLLKTNFGTIYTSEKNQKIFGLILDFVQKNTDKQDKIVVLRESSIVNFLTNRKTDDFYNHFEQISFEAFGEKKIINHYTENRPDYFILFTSETDSEAFCNGYAKSTCNWIVKNYKLKKVIKSEPLVLIFKKI